MKHLTVLGVLFRLHLFVLFLLLLGTLLYAVGGFQGFLPTTQEALLRFNQYLSIAGVITGLYALGFAMVALLRGRRRTWLLLLGVLLSTSLCAALGLSTLFLEAMIAVL
mgnify:FL=1